MKNAFLVTLTLIAFLFTTGGMAYAGNEANAKTKSQAQSSIDSHDKNTNEAMDRAFPIPGTARFGPVINYYGKPLPGSTFRMVQSLLKYANIFSEGALESIIKDGKDADLIVDLNIVRDRNVQVRAKYEKGETRWIKIVASMDRLPDHGLIAYVTSEADDRKTDMMEVMAGAALAALQEGADVLQIVAQGAARDTETSGWGIGFNTTQATMLSGGSVGSGGANVSSGGTGYSTAWAGMRDKPWLQANALKSPTKIIGVQIAKAEIKAEKAIAPVKKATTTAAPKPAVKVIPVKQTGNHTSAGSTQDS